MASSTSASLFNTTVHSNTTTAPHSSVEFCPPFRNANFETVGNSAPYIVNAALNVPLAIVTTFANLLVLLAMRHVTSIRLPSKLLLSSLALTDLGAGLVVQPQFAVFLFIKGIGNPYSIHSCFLFASFGFTGLVFASMSLLTMAAITLDRYTALFFHLKYQRIVTTRRVCAVLTFMWSLSLFHASAFLWNNALWSVMTKTGGFVSLLIISIGFIKIYRRLRGQHGHQVEPKSNDQAQQQAANTLNMAKYKKTASTMMWIYVLYIVCYLPFLCAGLVRAAIGHTALTVCIWNFSQTAVLLNSCLNPVVYCLRLPGEFRSEVLKQLRQFCCRSPAQHTVRQAAAATCVTASL